MHREDRLRPFRDRRIDAAGPIVNVAGSMSTKTGVAPTIVTASGVAKNVKDGVTTSSPRPASSARNAMTNASVPEFTPTACAVPRYAATSASIAST
jgi:hypothetical protein